MNIMKRKWFPPALIILAVLLFKGLLSLKSEPVKEEFVLVAPLVKVIELTSYNGSIKINGTGAVRSISEVNITPQVAGLVTDLGKNTSSGSSFKKGDLLFQIEKEDYYYRMQAAKAEVARQQVSLKSEEYESEIAKQEWDEYSDGSDEKASPLTLREPQLNMAKANLEASVANYNMAKLNVRRTKITAPYDGQVKHRMVDAGQYVAPGTSLASIFNSDESEIRVAVQPRDLDWVKIGQHVDIISEKKKWSGTVKTVGSNLDVKSRLATITVRVKNPYEQTPVLLNGLFVDVLIHGTSAENTFEIERHLIKNSDELWLLSNGKLTIKKVTVLYHGKHKSYISFQLKTGDKLIVSPIETPVENMKLRTN
jgi:RND family efflux transporter MFP subunit